MTAAGTNGHPQIGAAAIIAPHSQLGRPRLLLVEADRACAARILAALARPCCPPDLLPAGKAGEGAPAGPVVCACGAERIEDACCRVISSRRELRATDLDHFDVIITAVTLPDGSGLDVLAWVREVRPEMPVIMCGGPGDTVMAVKAIRAGALDFLVNRTPDLATLSLAIEKCLVHQRMKTENDRLQRELSRSLGELGVKNRQLQAMIHQLEVMTRTDELTGLCNRRWLNLKVEELWSRVTQDAEPLACLMIDLDEFKHINDEHGHQQGDDVLRLAAQVIETSCRPGDVAARYGGDEFCVLMPDTSWTEARRVAHTIVQVFRERMRERGASRRGASMSIGLAHTALSQPDSADQLISHADQAMYAAKERGKRQVRLYRPATKRAPQRTPAACAA